MNRTLIVALIALLCVGCTRDVSATYVQEAIDICSDKGGLTSIKVDSINSEQYVIEEAKCGDKSVVYLDSRKDT